MPSIKQRINLFAARRIRIEDTPLSYYVGLFQKAKPFSFARFGDGEWNAAIGARGANCDGHEFFPALGAGLRNALCNPLAYYYGIQRSALRGDGIKIARFIKQNRITIKWHNADVFHYANRDGALYPLIEQLRKMHVVVVGPAHLRKLSRRTIPYKHFIEIPTENCFRAADEIKQSIAAYSAANSGVVFSISASMAANVIIHDLFPKLGGKNWLIDFGSLWDIYAGIRSRGHYKKGNWEDIIRKNLKG